MLSGFDLPALRRGVAALPDAKARASLEDTIARARVMASQPRGAAKAMLNDGAVAMLEIVERNLHTVRLIPLARRDAKRQAGTRKPRRPEVDDWIATQLRRNPAAKCPALWASAPDWLTDQIGEDRFKKRVTDARKRVASN